MVDHPHGSFAVFVGHLDHAPRRATERGEPLPESLPQNGQRQPFEVWINGAEQPRGLGALAKSLSMDMRSNDRGWLKTKLESLMKASGDDGFELPLPPASPGPLQVEIRNFAQHEFNAGSPGDEVAVALQGFHHASAHGAETEQA